MGEWTLFSNHGHVLVCLANNNQARLRDVAAEVGITERAVQNILRELQDSGLVQVSKHGRCNHYQINYRKSLRHPLEAHCTVGNLLQLLRTADAEVSKPQAKTATEWTAQKLSGQSGKADAKTSKAPKAKPAKAVKPISKALPTETKPTETKPAVAKPVETTPSETRPAEAPPVATKPAESKPVEVKSTDTEPAEKKPTEAKPASSKKAKDKDGGTPSTQQGSLF